MLDPDCAKVHELYQLAGRPPLETLDPVTAREVTKRGRVVLQPDPPVMAEVRDLRCPGPGGEIGLRFYRPATAPPTPLPCLVYYHGGGWVIGDLETHDVLCRELAMLSRIAVVSVDYRLAPEHPFPAAVEDAIAALAWVAANGATLGIDTRCVSVGGDSAGGNLAIVAALDARDRGGPKLVQQLLIYPATDFSLTQPSHRDPTADVPPLTSGAMKWFKDHYLGQKDGRDWRASPLRAASLAGLPSAHVITAGYDFLRDEGGQFVERLGQAGVPVVHRHYPGMIHGFLPMGRIVREANRAVADAAEWLKTGSRGEPLVGGS